MTSLVRKLGLSPSLAFHDVYSLEDPSLLAFVPRPVYALLSRGRGNMVSANNKKCLWYDWTFTLCLQWWGKRVDRYGPFDTNLWRMEFEIMSQAPSTDLSNLISTAIPLDPASRARLLEKSPNIALAHASAAAQGDSAPPSADESIDLHFVAFVKSAENNLWELDGRRKGPLNRGKLQPEDDVLAESALDLGVRKFLKREEEGQGGEMRFSLIALAPSMD
ncbi:MAG: hypothetical protein Q9167_000565 [Letrouitia subvulpina]